MTCFVDTRLMIKQPFENNATQENHLYETQSEHYRNHQLSFAASNGFCIGEVFKKTEKLAYCEAVDIDSARQYCRQIIDDSLAQDVARNNNSHPSLDDLSHALQSIQAQLGKASKYLLREHLKENNHPIDSDHLKSIGGFTSTTDVMFAYAHFARLLCDALSYVPPHQHSGQDAYLSMAISTHEPSTFDQNALKLSSHEHKGFKPIGLAISLSPPIFTALQQIDNL